MTSNIGLKKKEEEKAWGNLVTTKLVRNDIIKKNRGQIKHTKYMFGFRFYVLVLENKKRKKHVWGRGCVVFLFFFFFSVFIFSKTIFLEQ